MYRTQESVNRKHSFVLTRILRFRLAGLQSGTHLHTESTFTQQMLCCRISTLTFKFLTNFKISNFKTRNIWAPWRWSE